MSKVVVVLSILSIFGIQSVYGQVTKLEAQPENAVEATLQLFDTYPAVGIGEAHSLEELGDFYIELVHHPAFAQNVGNVVFEFGNSFFQPVIDKYLAGENVPYEEVKKAWTTTIAAGGPHEVSVMYGQFYKAAKEVNSTLTKDKKIKIWLGDPPANPDDPPTYSDANFPDRDAFFAETVMHKVLAKGQKALLIIGAGHFMSGNSMLGGSSATVLEVENRQPYAYDVRAFLDAYYPNKLFVIQIHWGLPKLMCNRELEAELKKWPPPYLLSLRDTPLADFLNGSRCKAESDWGDLTRAWGDAYLYLGQSDNLTVSPLPDESATPYLELVLKAYPEFRGRRK